MGRIFVRANPDYADASFAPVSSYPLSMSAWYKPTTNAVIMDIVTIRTNATPGPPFNNHIDLGTNGPRASAFIRDSSNGAGPSSATNLTTGVWHHIAVVYPNSTTQIVYLDGVGTSNTSAAINPAGMNHITVGDYRTGFSSPPFDVNPTDGAIAEVAVWNVALSQTDTSALAAGVSPLFIEKPNLLNYWRILGLQNPEPDLLSSNSLFVTGTTVTTDNPPVQFFSPSAAPAAILAPDLSHDYLYIDDYTLNVTNDYQVFD